MKPLQCNHDALFEGASASSSLYASTTGQLWVQMLCHGCMSLVRRPVQVVEEKDDPL